MQILRAHAGANERRSFATLEPARSRPARPDADRWRRTCQPGIGEVSIRRYQTRAVAPRIAASVSARAILVCLACAGLVLLVSGVLDAALAQMSPFGTPRAAGPTVPAGGMMG